MLQRNPNLPIFTIILIALLCYAFWSWIKPSLVLPSHAINYTKKYILTISKIAVIISSLALPLHLSLLTFDLGLRKTPVILVIDQSRSMSHNDLTPSRRSVAQHIIKQIFVPFENEGSTSETGDRRFAQLITYALIPQLHSGISEIKTIQPIASQQGSSALGDARLISYDQIGSGLNYKPIVITITDGGSNTGYDLGQTSQILKTRAQLWIVGLSTGTQIVAYDDEGLGLTSTMDSALLRSLADSGHRYTIPDDTSVSGVIDALGQDLRAEHYQLGPITYHLSPILWILLGLGVLGLTGIYIIKKPLRPL